MTDVENIDRGIPGHIPNDLVVDVDFYKIERVDVDPYAAWLAVRDRSPRVFFTPRNGGHWVVSRAVDVEEVLQDASLFTSYGSIPPGLKTEPYPDPPIGVDPPEHGPYRQLLTPNFTPKAILEMEAYVRQITIDLIGEFRDKGRCEFVKEFANRMPIGVFLHLMGLPESDRLRLLGYTDLRMRGATEAERFEGQRALKAYACEKVRERRESPGNDLLSRIANGLIEGELIQQSKAESMVVTLLLAGLDTVVNTVSFIASFLAAHPEHRRHLAVNPGAIPVASEELIRRFAVPNIVRAVKVDQEFRGVKMRAGDRVLAIVPLTGVDESRYSDPLTVDFGRSITRLGNFGVGAHRCVGVHLAKLEVRVFLEEWMRLIPDFTIDPEDRVINVGGNVVGVGHLPLVWNTGRPEH